MWVFRQIGQNLVSLLQLLIIFRDNKNPTLSSVLFNEFLIWTSFWKCTWAYFPQSRTSRVRLYSNETDLELFKITFQFILLTKQKLIDNRSFKSPNFVPDNLTQCGANSDISASKDWVSGMSNLPSKLVQIGPNGDNSGTV